MTRLCAKEDPKVLRNTLMLFSSSALFFTFILSLSLFLSSFTLHVLSNAIQRHSRHGIPRRIIILQFRRHAAHQRLFLAANSAGVPDETAEAATAAATVVILDGTATTFYARLKTVSRQFFVGRVGLKLPNTIYKEYNVTDSVFWENMLRCNRERFELGEVKVTITE